MKTNLFGLCVLLLCALTLHMGQSASQRGFTVVPAPGGVWVHKMDGYRVVLEWDVPAVRLGTYVNTDGAWSYACPRDGDCRISGTEWTFIAVTP